MSVLRRVGKGLNAAAFVAFVYLNWQLWSGYSRLTFVAPTVVLVAVAGAVELLLGVRAVQQNDLTLL